MELNTETTLYKTVSL